MKAEFRQCARCVMDTSDPQIQFDEDGYCNHCTSFLVKLEELKSKQKTGTENLTQLIEQIKKAGKNKKYEVVLGISGGVDSCYTAYLLKKLNIRTLLVHLDNGWDSNEAIQNIKNVAKKFEFDYQSYVLDWEEFRSIQLAFLKASVVEAETPTDIAIQGALHKIAAKNRVKYIVSAGNEASEGILPKLWHYNAKDTKYFHYILKTFGSKRVRNFPNFGFFSEVYYKFMKGIKIVYPLNYLNYNKEEAQTILKEQIDWKHYGGKHHESRFTKFIQSYLLPIKFNLDYRKATYSSQICAGQMSREEAIEKLKTPPFVMEEVECESKYIAKKLGISLDELQRIVSLPGKYYYEYPNSEKVLTLFYGAYKRYFQ